MTQKNESKPASSASTNYYEILEVSADAPSHEIHRAYQRARETYSQDNPALYSMFSAEEARELLRMIEEAFAVLSNTSLRRSYDESMSRGEGAPVLEPQASVPSPAVAAAHSPAPSAAQLKSEHQALPDFASPADSPSEAFSVRKREPAKTELAPGMSKTPVSTYKVDSAFEAEIQAATEFDGMLLQRIRVYKNISLERMSESTRISRPYLTALETNDYKSLPAAVFVRGFVTQVARNLGIDENKAATTYMKRFKAGGGK
jgi:hypothetical protein